MPAKRHLSLRDAAGSDGDTVPICPPDPEDFAAEARRQMVEYEAVPADYPHLLETVGGSVARFGYDYDTEFLFSLDVILDGLERILEKA